MERLATTREVADYLSVHPKSLDRWASRGEGPPYVIVGTNRRYDMDAVREWTQGQTITAGPRFKCSICKKNADKGAHIVVLSAHLAEARESRKRYEKYLAEREGEFFSLDFDMLPEPAPWGIVHDVCDDQLGRVHYAISTERVASWPAFTGTVAHLLEKGWAARDTDMTGLLRKVSGR